MPKSIIQIIYAIICGENTEISLTNWELKKQREANKMKQNWNLSEGSPMHGSSRWLKLRKTNKHGLTNIHSIKK